MQIHLVERNEAASVVAASSLFDARATLRDVERFLNSTGHFLFLAYEDGEPVGFVSGVEMTHPDKGREMFLYELGVAVAFRGRGIGTALIAALRDLAQARGCYGMWVLTDDDNAAALAVYQAAGGGTPSRPVMLSWEFDLE